MRKWITRIIQGTSVDATAQAKDDIADIGVKNGYSPLHIFRYDSAYESDQAIQSRIDGITAAVAQGDLIVYQYPTLISPRFDRFFLDQMHRRAVKVVLLIHDVELLRGTNSSVSIDEIPYFNDADVLIIHNPAMGKKLRELGVKTPMISQYLLDYLDDHHDWRRLFTSPEEFTRTLVLSGNLFKSSYLTGWSQETPITVFGIANDNIKNGLDNNPKVDYRGSFWRDDLINKLPKGFGLAWDSDSNMGKYGSYTRFNHPHKLSLYLSHGMPVIVWNQSAVAPFVEANHLGMAIGSLSEIDKLIASIPDEQISDMLTHVNDIGVLLRDGYFTTRALIEAEQQVFYGHINFS
ncbi:sugar transferase [Schleiferilactobacillus perolens]|uniref:sugar transferase n=1 Tax=Schleiferilactobacillus perolens TaxID=100468 RepID=UPI0023573948|nr:sugar transferase [Schleiferilactobacillus perolens]MCI2172562.1 sugar transferase [Schleiferilactobacillus perolens]